LKKFWIENIEEFYDDASGILSVTQQKKDQTHEKHALFLSEEELVKLFKLHLLCEAINSLSDPSYLPEIDFKLMNLLFPDRDGVLQVNLQEFGSEIGINGAPRVKRSVPFFKSPQH
jgi:hypothetical protein